MNKSLFILLALVLVSFTFAVGESTSVERHDGQVFYRLQDNVFIETKVTPFSARAYQFVDPERIAKLFFGDSEYSLEFESFEVKKYVGNAGSLTVSKPEIDSGLSFDSEYTNTVFTPIPLVLDIYRMSIELEDEDQELSFMSRSEVETEVERFVNEIYEGLNFRSIANFAITRSDYEACYENRRDELEVLIGSNDKTVQDMRPKENFPHEDLGYLICLAQEVNELPISWSCFQNVPGMQRNLPVEIWVFWTPYGCKYFWGDTVMDPLESTDSCEVISREEAMDAFAEAYNYILGTQEIEVHDMNLVWFTDIPEYDYNSPTPGNIVNTEIRFRPMWCIYTPQFYGEGTDHENGYYVDACTGEVWI